MRVIAVLFAILVAAEEKSEQSPKIEYRGKQFTRERFLRHAKKVSYRELQRNSKLIGFAVEVEGTIEEIGAVNWLFAITDRKDRIEGTVTIDPTGLGENDFREGMVARLYGIVREDRSLEAVLLDLVPPGVEWQYALRPIKGGVRGGQVQRYFIDGRVRNTGKQPISRLKVVARMYQENSPNDELRRFEIEELKPGETRPLEVEFLMYNFQYIGSTSIPKCELRVVDYEL